MPGYENDFRTRKFSVDIENKTGKPSTLDEDTRTVSLTIVSETRDVLTYDRRLGYVPEVLVMSGGKLPSNGQVPLLDSHDRFSVGSVVGSVRSLTFENDRLSGTAHYSSVESARDAFTKLEEGHLTDYSGGFRVHRREPVEEGQRMEIGGRAYDGPAVLITDWTLQEVSTCPVGADASAKARMKTNDTEKESIMPEIIETDADDRRLQPDARHRFKDEGYHQVSDEEHRKIPQRVKPKEGYIDVDQERAEAAQTARQDEQGRILGIMTLCERYECADISDGLVKDGKTIDQARAAVLDAIDKRKTEQDKDKPGFRIEMGLEGRDKFRDAATDALRVRGGIVTLEARSKLSPGHDELMGYSLRELARRSLVYANQSDRGTVVDMVGRALTTSDFPVILSNLANMSLAQGYESAGETWAQWAATGSVPDFKINTIARVSELDDLEEIGEDGEYKYGAVDESKEQYQIATYGKMFKITRKTIINDDLNALTDIPSKHGEAAARKVGDIAYAVLTANSAMGDGVALFHADHSNLAGTPTVIGTAGMAAGIKAMGLQKDMKGKRRLNLRPEFVLAPKSVEAGAEVFFTSEKFDVTDAGATRNNIYAGTKYTRIYEGRLDDFSETAWFMLATKGKTVKVFFLNGVMTPYMETRQGWHVDGVEYKVRMDAGAKALDWKTLYKNDGL